MGKSTSYERQKGLDVTRALAQDKPNPLTPTPALLVTLGSIIRHADEMLDPVTGHHFDLNTFKLLISQPEVQDWFKAMDEMALLPVKRGINKREK